MTLKQLQKLAKKYEDGLGKNRNNLLKVQDMINKKLEPSLKMAIGKCYKYKNSYSCPEKESDYWWLFSKIIDVKDGKYILESFQIDKYGEVSIEFNNRMLTGYKEITQEEYEFAKKELFNYLKKEKFIESSI